jgi:Tol biopolymer transport system component
MARAQDESKLLLLYGDNEFRTLSPTGQVMGIAQTGKLPVWAPGHKQFAFQSGPNVITVTTVGTNANTTFSVTSTIELLSWTCSDKILFQTQSGQGVTYLTLSDKQSHVVPLQIALLSSPEISPDCSSLVFSGQESSRDDIGVFTAHLDGTNLQRLTSGSIDNTPTWSPDGSKIAFVRLAPWRTLSPSFASNAAVWYRGRVFVMNADGSEPNQISSATSPASRVAWSPDGSQLAVVTPWSSISEFWIVSVTGAQRALIYTSAFGELMDPSAGEPLDPGPENQGMYYGVQWK